MFTVSYSDVISNSVIIFKKKAFKVNVTKSTGEVAVKKNVKF